MRGQSAEPTDVFLFMWPRSICAAGKRYVPWDIAPAYQPTPRNQMPASHASNIFQQMPSLHHGTSRSCAPLLTDRTWKGPMRQEVYDKMKVTVLPQLQN